MRSAVIVQALRTPIGRHGGALSAVRPDDLAATVVRAVVERSGVPPEVVDDVVLGCANQAGEDNRNVARMAVLLAGLPVSVPGQTVNRLCGSGMQAVISAAHAIMSGEGECIIAGGVESMSRAPWVMMKPFESFPRSAPEVFDSTIGWRFVNHKMRREWTISLGETAEEVAARFGITREDQDRFALRSQQRAAAAIAAGRFQDEIVPVAVNDRKGMARNVLHDEHPRPDVTLQLLGGMRPAFRREGGTVTAGTSSGINDGASALMLMEEACAKKYGLRPLARIVSSGVAGVSPEIMGVGPVPAVRIALRRAGVGIDDVDLIELNEAFAAQVIACMRELGADEERVNVNGGGIALGHPLGSSGARILATLVHEMRRRDARRGLAAMCVGVGQGTAVLIEGVS